MYGGPISIAIANNNIYIGYRDVFEGHLKFAKWSSVDNQWTIKTVDSPEGTGLFVSISVLGKNIYMSYHKNISGLTGELLFAKSIDDGDNWTTEVIDSDINNDGDPGKFNPIAVAGNNIYISYDDDCLKLAKSTNGGVDWSFKEIQNKVSGAKTYLEVLQIIQEIFNEIKSIKLDKDYGYSTDLPLTFQYCTNDEGVLEAYWHGYPTKYSMNELLNHFFNIVKIGNSWIRVDTNLIDTGLHGPYIKLLCNHDLAEVNWKYWNYQTYAKQRPYKYVSVTETQPVH